MSTKFFVYISGRWCEINTENGEVSGFREKPIFVYLSKGKLIVAKRPSVLRGLRALASGHKTTVREGPQLPYKKTHPPEAKRSGENYNLHKHHHRCCCAKAQTQGCCTDLNSNKILEKRFQITVAKESVATQCSIDTGMPADDVVYNKPLKRRHEALTDDDLPTPKTVPNPSQNNNKSIELSKTLEKYKFANKKYNSNLYRELLISDEDVAVFRRFLIKNKTDVDLCKFDCDDAYKAKMFYAINPLVDIERSPLIRVQKENSSDEMTIKKFAVKLGLVSVEDVKKDTRYKTRNSRNKPKMRVPEVNSDSPTSDSDFENSNPNSKNFKKQLKADKTNKLQKKPHTARTNTFKTKRQWIKDDTSNDDSDDQSTHLKIRHSLNKHNTKVGTKDKKRGSVDKPNNKIQVTVNQHGDNNKQKGTSNRNTKLKTEHSATKPTAKPRVKYIQNSDSESSGNSEANIKVNTRSNSSKKDQNNRVNNASSSDENPIQDSDSSGKSKDNVKVNKRHSLSKKNLNVPVEDMSTNQTVDKKYVTKSNVAGPDVIKKKHDISRKDMIVKNNVNNRKDAVVDIKDLGNDIDKENINMKISKENIRQNILKKLDKKSVTPVSESDGDNKKRKERDSKTSKLSDDKKVVQKVGPKFKVPKRSSVPAGKEYTNLEDHAIVAWVSNGGRARKVNGNRLWRELQMDYHKLTGQSRSWHSLRNRYLRYLLPGLHALTLPPALCARLRAAAATGEIKSRKKKSSGASAPLSSAPSAWSLRPRTPRPAPPAGETTLVDDIHLSPTRDRRSASRSSSRSREASSLSETPSVPSTNHSPVRHKRSSRSRRRSASNSQPRPKYPSPPRSKNSRSGSGSQHRSTSSGISPPRSKKTSQRRSRTRQRSPATSTPQPRRPSPPWRGISPPVSSRSAHRSLRAIPRPVQKTRKLFNPNAPSIMN